MNEWKEILDSENPLVVFGVTKSAMNTTDFITRWTDRQIIGYLVSQPDDNPKFFNGRKVYSFSDFDENDKKRMDVIVSQSWHKTDAIVQLLRQNGFVNIYPSAVQLKTELTDSERKEFVDMFAEGIKSTVKKAGTCRIYAVTSHLNLHKRIELYNSKYITYIQAGAALTDISMCDLKDNVGENISEKNPYYCELTAGYWAAKNDKTSDFLGLYHYSRGLDLTDDELERRLCDNKTVIVAYPYLFRYSMIAKFRPIDYEVFQKAILSVSPEYKDAMDLFFSQRYFVPGNIMIASGPIFCLYYDWLIKIIEKCEDVLCNEYNQTIPKRFWGYYGEELMNIFLLHHRRDWNISFAQIKNLSV